MPYVHCCAHLGWPLMVLHAKLVMDTRVCSLTEPSFTRLPIWLARMEEMLSLESLRLQLYLVSLTFFRSLTCGEVAARVRHGWLGWLRECGA